MDNNSTARRALVALARAGMRNSPYLGHFGSAMLAGYFLCEEFDLPAETVAAIRDCLPLLTIGELAELFKDDEKKEKANPQFIQQLRDYLLDHVGNLSRSGHVAIIGMYVLKALKVEPSMATPGCINGIIQLLDAYGKERPQSRYYGYPLEYGTTDMKRSKILRYKNAKDALTTAISESRILYPNTKIKGIYYYFVGEKLHGLTHAHALYEFECMGEKDIAMRAYPAHRLQMLLDRVRPPNIKPIKGLSRITPEHREFWHLVPTFKHELGIPHALKRSYALFRARHAGIQGLGQIALQRFSYVFQGW